MDVADPEHIEPGPGQESVWDYPRPPRLERTTSRLVVALDGVTIAETTTGYRVLETSQPPAYYLPPGDVDGERLVASTAQSFCEWKGLARYFTIAMGDRVVPDAAWCYPHPTDAFAAIADHLAFYPQRIECSVDGEAVAPNEGSFYGGWITSRIVGPFKGGAGTAHW